MPRPTLTSALVRPIYVTGRLFLFRIPHRQPPDRNSGIIVSFLPLTLAARDHVAFEGRELGESLNQQQVLFLKHHLYHVIESDDRWNPQFEIEGSLSEITVSETPPTLCSPEDIKLTVAFAIGDLQRRKEIAQQESQLGLVSTLNGEIARGRAHFKSCRPCHLRHDSLAYMFPHEALPKPIRFIVGKGAIRELRRLESAADEQH